MKNRKAKNLYIPIEIKVREFDAKLLLSLIAAERGFRVILGSQKDLRTYVAWLPPGIYLDKSIAATKVKWFKYFKKYGHKVVAWDEEGLIIHKKTYLKQRVSEKSFDLTDCFFSWGKIQTNLLREKFENNFNKVRVTGNPRIDMLRCELRNYYKYEVERIKNKYGKFILINTNFSFYNHIIDSSEAKKSILKNHPELGEEFVDGWIAYQYDMFNYFVKLLPKLEEYFPQWKIIIRPHPSEKHQRWIDIAKNKDNVHVIHEKNVIEWLLASDVMLHSNCSTGVEAFLLDVPVIAYEPIKKDSYDTFLPNCLSIKSTTEEDVVETLKKILFNRSSMSSSENTYKRNVALDYISNLEGSLASDVIVEQLWVNHAIDSYAQLSIHEKMKRVFIEGLPFVKRRANSVLEMFKQIEIMNLNEKSKKISQKIVRESIQKQKMPDLTIDEVQEGLMKFRRALGGRFKNIKISSFGKNCFLVQREG